MLQTNEELEMMKIKSFSVCVFWESREERYI